MAYKPYNPQTCTILKSKFKMENNEEERKAQLASYLAKVLDTLSLSSTARILRHEAKLDFRPNIAQEVQAIVSTTPDNPAHQQQRIHQYFHNYLKKLIRENYIAEALEVFENELPLYVDDLEPFSLMFASIQAQDNLSISNILEKFITENSLLPQQRLNCLQYEAQIWMMEVLGKAVLAIDDKNSARVIREGTVSAWRLKLHEAQIYCVAVNNEDSFVTGGDDKLCRVWNSKLELLYEHSRHSQTITSICCIMNQIASFDKAGTIIVTKEIPSVSTAKNSIACFRLKGIAYCDVKYISGKNCIVGAGNVQGKGRIDLADLQNRRCTTKLSLQQRIYNIELSNCQKLIFVNLSSMSIHAYTTSKFQLQFKVSGYQQMGCLMRMAVGGPQGDLLAVTSEEGCVCIYSIRKKALIGKIKGLSGKCVNCVRWIQNDLYFGCDGGFIEHWGSSTPAAPTNHNGHIPEAQCQILEEQNCLESDSHQLQQIE